MFRLSYVHARELLQTMSFTDTDQSLQREFAKFAAGLLLTQLMAEAFTGWGCALSAD